MPWRLPQRSVSLSHFAAPCQQLFFVFVNFFHRSGKVVFLSAVRETTQSSTRCQQLFPLFDFFHPLDALSSLRGVNLVKTTLAVNNFFATSEKILAGPFRPPVVHGARCAIVKARSVRPLRRPSGARSVYGPFRAKGQDNFCVKDKEIPPADDRGEFPHPPQDTARYQNPVPAAA